ncbi:PDR/VanB family oxidoreductase [Metapseudomonas furukawaii]|uniref:PDR/VanB family oxidoreductase n=1 Tax=Metapseudomonas furukawaii TaxID=1149133 RepID=UPI00227C0EC1|nr:PDR/VanB family oxidoreductase [Pseudomonas furukawaii]WAG76892.1 PDR/VanB family oxidoreductase [Pseudomonas furukawaii]
MLDLMIRSLRLEAPGILGLELEAADGAPLPAFEAGAHLDLHLPGGLVRQYSLCNAPGETHRYRLAVLLDPASRGGSRAVHEQLRVGQRLTTSAPRNLFALASEGARSLLFAGGIGITPILAMAQALASRDEDFELHYCMRSRKLAAFVDWLEASPFADRVRLHADDGPAPLDAPALLRDAGNAHLYVCGPNGFMEHVLGCARTAGWDESRLHREYFVAPAQPAGEDRAFEVRLARSGLTLQVPAGRSVAQVLDEAGVCVPLSCEQGICGTCLTGVLDGEPEHRDSFLTDAERARNDQFTPCCSRARSACLVLDL